MRKLLRILLWVGIGIVVLYLGLTCYGNIANKRDAQGLPDLPTITQAAYFVKFNDTGNVIMTNDFEQQGDIEGQRVFVLHGYYEYTKKGYIYRDVDITLKEKSFGIINIRERR